jgi:hypothetical protein
MRLEVHRIDSLPPLAWVAEVFVQDGLVVARCGLWVEAGDGWFIEGIWDGAFGGARYDETEGVFGTGAVLRDGAVTFVSSVATTDFLYHRLHGSSVLVSNSLSLLLSCSDDELDPACDRYDLINKSIIRGINGYTSRIPTRRGFVERLMHRNLMVDGVGTALLDKPAAPRFSSFDDYHSYLDAACRRLLANARDKDRSLPFIVATTQSKGYDTTAVNAVARKYGIDVAYTISKAKGRGVFADGEEGEQSDDDGAEICRILGLENVVQIDRREFTRAPETERLLYAALDANDDANFLGICERLPAQPSLLLTGTLGEIWYPSRLYNAWREPSVGADLPRWDLGTHGLTELRLSSGFVHAPLIYLGARNRDDIFAISDSGQMQPWSIAGAYNRPIPRRIAEQAGVPRHAFGQRKMATVVEAAAPRLPWGQELREEYKDFLITHNIMARPHWSLLPLVRRWNTIVAFAPAGYYKAAYYASRIMYRVFGKELPVIWRSLNGRLFCFGVNKRIAEYRAALEPAREAAGVSHPLKDGA